MTRTELQSLISEVAREEIKKYVGTRLPLVVKEVVDELVEERLVEILKSSDGKALNESWPTLGNKTLNTSNVGVRGLNREKLSTMLGYGNAVSSGEKLNLPDAVMTQGDDMRNPIPVNPADVPKEIIVAMNKDYRSFLNKMSNYKAPISLGPVNG